MVYLVYAKKIHGGKGTASYIARTKTDVKAFKSSPKVFGKIIKVKKYKKLPSFIFR